MKQIAKKKKFVHWIFLAFELCFMLFIFAPIDLFYSNKDEFWFTLGQFMSVEIVVFAAVFAILLLCFFGLSRLKPANQIYAAITSVMLYLYVQGNYVPRKYGVLNGESIEWDSYTGYAAASIILIAVFIVACIVICIKFKHHIASIGKTASVFLFLIQLVTIGTLTLQNLNTQETSDDLIITDNGQFELSSDDNIVIFLLDTFDTEFMTNIINSEPEKYDSIFENFTFYANTLGAYPTTKCGIPQILTGKWYENREPFYDYVDAAYTDNEIYKTLADNNYAVEVYGEPFYMSYDKVNYENVKKGKYTISDRTAFAKKMSMFIFFNYMPHQLKQHFFTDTDSLALLKGSDSAENLYNGDVQAFAEKLGQDGISVSNGSKRFKFYYLWGTHAPWTFGEDLTSDSSIKYTPYDEAKGNSELLRRYFDEMKAKGVYDNTTIVLIADHGRNEYSQNPLFMIKNKGEQHPFEISDAPMTFEHCDNIWIALAKGEVVDSSFIESCPLEYGRRRFLHYNWDDAWSRKYMPAMEEMFCNNYSTSVEDLESSGKVFVPADEDYSYTMGTTLEFIDERTGYSYSPFGISNGYVCCTAALKFDLKDQSYENILFKASTIADGAVGMTYLYANGQLVAELAYGNDEEYNIVIPGEVVGEDNILQLTLSQEQLTEGETNADMFTKTHLRLDTVVLESTAGAFDLESQRMPSPYAYELGTDLLPEKILQYSMNGLSVNEESHIWTNGNVAKWRFDITDTSKNIKWNMTLGTYNGIQPVYVYANNNLISEFSADGYSNHSVIIPQHLIADGTLFLTLDLPNAIAPYKIDPNSTDERRLALDFTIMSFIATDEENTYVPTSPTDNSAQYEYTIGTALSFTASNNTATEYIVSGFSGAEEDGTWTNGRSAEMQFTLKDYDGSPLNVSLNFKTLKDGQKVIVFAGDKEIYSFETGSEGNVTFDVPSDRVSNNSLQLRFELPDAVSPAALEIGDDKRLLTLKISDIIIS